jgi:hypothetical protein
MFFLVAKDLNSCFKGNVTYTSTTFTVTATLLIVGDKRVFNLSANFDATSVFAIDANGNTTGAILPSEAKAKLYVSNGGLLRGSAVTVTNANWLHLGDFYLDENNQIKDFDPSYKDRCNKVVTAIDEETEDVTINIPLINLRSRPILITLDFSWNGTSQKLELDGDVIVTGNGASVEHVVLVKETMTAFQTLSFTTTDITSFSNFICQITFI